MGDNVLNIDRSRIMSEPPPRNSAMSWAPIAFTIIGMVGSSIVSALVAGTYVGQFRTSLDNISHLQETDRVEFKQRLTDLSSLVNNLNANLAGVTAGLKGLSDALSLERQDRLNSEIRRAGGK